MDQWPTYYFLMLQELQEHGKGRAGYRREITLDLQPSGRMKINTVTLPVSSLATMHLLPFLAIAPLTSAQYLSQGWQPGQPASITQDAPAPVYTPQPGTSSPSSGLSELFSVHTLLTWSPVASLLEHLGVNITERVSLTKARLWDERITFITDDNFQELVVREPLTEEQAKDRVWIVIMYRFLA